MLAHSNARGNDEDAMLLARKAAIAGCTFIREHIEGGMQKIDIRLVQVDTPDRCPLSLASGKSYSEAVRYYRIRDPDRLGFKVGAGALYDYAALTQAYRDIVPHFRD